MANHAHTMAAPARTTLNPDSAPTPETIILTDDALLASWSDYVTAWHALAVPCSLEGLANDLQRKPFFDRLYELEGLIAGAPAASVEGLRVKLALLFQFINTNPEIDRALMCGEPIADRLLEDSDFLDRLAFSVLEDVERMLSPKRVKPDTAFFVLWEEFVNMEREFRRISALDDSDETMGPLSERCQELRDRLIATPVTTVKGWVCKLKLTLLAMANLPETVFSIDSFSGPIPAAIASPEMIEDAALPWLWGVITEMDRATNGKGG